MVSFPCYFLSCSHTLGFAERYSSGCSSWRHAPLWISSGFCRSHRKRATQCGSAFVFVFVLVFCSLCFNVFLKAKNNNGFLGFGSGLWWKWRMGLYWRLFLLCPCWNITWKNKCPTRSEGKVWFFFGYMLHKYSFSPLSYALISFIVTCNLNYSSLRNVISFMFDILMLTKKRKRKKKERTKWNITCLGNQCHPPFNWAQTYMASLREVVLRHYANLSISVYIASICNKAKLVNNQTSLAVAF